MRQVRGGVKKDVFEGRNFTSHLRRSIESD